MEISLTELDARGADRAALIDFLTADSFPFHVVADPAPKRVAADIDNGRWGDDDHRSFWVVSAENGRIGLAALSDLTDDTPLVDLRIGSPFRGRGYGAAVLRALTDRVFGTMPAVSRLEGNTRADNTAMRKVFAASGFVKEAHYRDGWPIVDGPPMDSVAYAILRRDWESGSTTPVEWDDLPQ